MKTAAYLKRVRAILREHDRELGLRPPAKAAAIAALKLEVPAELRAAWRVGDGSREGIFARPGFLAGYTLLSLAAAKRERSAMKKRAPQYAGYADPEPRDKRIAPGWFDAGWLPFASGADGALLMMVDTTRRGQVIAYSHDPDRISYVAPSFEKFLDGSRRAFEKDAEELLSIY